MDINKEIAEHTTQVEAIITKYLPKESGYQKTVTWQEVSGCGQC